MIADDDEENSWFEFEDEHEASDDFWADELAQHEAAGRRLLPFQNRLLACLRVDGKLADAAGAWRAIVDTAQCHPREASIANPIARTLAVRARHTSGKITLLIKALKALTEVLEHDEPGAYFENALRERDSIVHASTHERLEKLREDVEALMALPRAGEELVLPDRCIHQLAILYEKWTGLRYTISRNREDTASRFVEFVYLFSEATGRCRPKSTIVSDIRRVRPPHSFDRAG